MSPDEVTARRSGMNGTSSHCERFVFMSEGVQQEEQSEQKALECEGIAAKLQGEGPFRRVYFDLAAK
jgi:hypothetical protein